MSLTAALKKWYIKTIPGMNNKVEDLDLQNRWVEVAQNCRFEDEPGAVDKRDPVTYYNTSSVGSGPVNGLFRFYTSTGSSVWVKVHGTKAYVGNDTAGTFTAIRSNLTSGKRHSFVVYKDQLIAGNGYDNLWVYDGSSDNVTWELGACKAIASTAGGGSVTSGSAYYYAVTIGTADEYVCGAVSNTITATTSGTINLSKIPLGPLGTAGRKIYRTVGNGSTLKLVATIANNTATTYTDTVADGSLGVSMPAVNDDMPKGSELQVHRERLFVSCDPSNPSLIYYSNPYLPGYIQQTTGPDILQISPEDGDVIMGIPIQLGVMVCIKKNKIRKLHITSPVSGADPATWYADDPIAWVGSPAQWSITQTPNGIVFLGYDHWYIFDGASAQPIFDEFDTGDILDANYSDVVGFYHNGSMLAAYTDRASGSQVHNRIMRYNFKRQALSYDLWTSSTLTGANCFGARTGDGEPGDLYYGDSANGYVVKDKDVENEYRLTTKTQANAGELIVDNCEDNPVAWVDGSGGDCTVSRETSIVKVGSASVKTIVAAGAGVELLIYHNITSVDLSGYTTVSFWFYTTVALSASDFQFLIDNTAACASPLETINFPAVSASTWTKVNLTIATPSALTAVVSIGIKQAVDKGAMTFYIDNITVNNSTNVFIGGTENAPYMELGRVIAPDPIPDDICVFWDDATTTPGTGWTEITSTYEGRAILVHTTALTTSAGSSHTHLLTGSIPLWSGSTVNYGDGNPGAVSAHSHEVSSASGAATPLPRHINYRVFKKNNTSVEYEFPDGSIIMYDQAAAPDGWQMQSSLGYSGYYACLSTAGLDTITPADHTHTFNIPTGTAAGSLAQSDSGTNGPAFGHNHTVTGTLSSANLDTWELDYVSLNFIKKIGESDSWDGVNRYAYCLFANSTTPGNGWTEDTTYTSKYLKIGSALPSTGASANTTHTHVAGTFTTSTESAQWGNGGYHATGYAGPHTHQVVLTAADGTVGAPPSVTFRLMKKVLGQMKEYNDASTVSYTSGSWISPPSQISAESLNTMYWNQLVSGTDTVTIATRTGATQAACQAASFSTALTNPNGSAITSTANVWFQYKIIFTATDSTLTNPRIYLTNGYVVRYTYHKGATNAETSVNFQYSIGFRNFDEPAVDKIYKKIATKHVGTQGSFDLNWATENSSDTFTVSLASYPTYWDSYFQSSALGREIDIEIVKNDLYSFRISEIEGLYSPNQVVI